MRYAFLGFIVETRLMILASLLQGHDNVEKQRVVGVVVGKGCLKRSAGELCVAALGADASLV